MTYALLIAVGVSAVAIVVGVAAVTLRYKAPERYDRLRAKLDRGVWRARGWFSELWRWIAVALVLAGLAIVGLVWVPQWIVPTAPTDADLLRARSGTRTAAVAMVAAAGAALGTAFVARTFFLARQGQVTDRYIKAVEQLESAQPLVVTAGIYALGRVARDSRRDHDDIMEVLAWFLRTFDRGNGTDVPPQVQAACTVLARRNTNFDRDLQLDLREADLRRVRLDGAQLRNCILIGAKLDGAYLTRANLRGANVRSVTAPSSRWDGACLQKAVFNGAQLQSATFDDVRAGEAQFESANLRGAFFRHATLRNANLTDATARGLQLTGTSLTNANLEGAHLEGAKLGKVKIDGANFTNTTFDRDTSWDGTSLQTTCCSGARSTLG
jgi:uncharacterized protein YjbI with pentapeptide repeats